jgi:S-adenosylhomocysteine hydrolase
MTLNETLGMLPGGVPVPVALATAPFDRYPMLRWGTNTIQRHLGAYPFHGIRTAMVLHLLDNLLPFVTGCEALGLRPSLGTLFFKSSYEYPRKAAIVEWLVTRGYEVHPVEAVDEWIARREGDEAACPLLIVEDGGYLAPLLHARRSPVLGTVLGAVEQTTKGLRAIEDWGVRSGAVADDLADALRFPLVSVPDSRIKREIEPEMIATNAVKCVTALCHALSFQGLPTSVLGLGGIGMKVVENCQKYGAQVTGFDIDDSRRLMCYLAGGRVAGTAAEAVRGKRLVIGCSGRQSITADVIANLEHGSVVASVSSDLEEIDLAYVEDRSVSRIRVDADGHASPVGELWAGTRYLLPGNPPREITILADGYPATFWGFGGMPHQGGDLIMTVMLLAAAELAGRNGPSRDDSCRYANGISRRAVDDLAKKYSIEAEYQRIYFPELRR